MFEVFAKGLDIFDQWSFNGAFYLDIRFNLVLDIQFRYSSKGIKALTCPFLSNRKMASFFLWYSTVIEPGKGIYYICICHM